MDNSRVKGKKREKVWEILGRDWEVREKWGVVSEKKARRTEVLRRQREE